MPDLLTLENCSAGREIGEPRLDPSGRRLAAVMTEPFDPTSDRKPQSFVEVIDLDDPASEWRVLAGIAVRSVRGLGGGTFDWTPDGGAIVAVAADGDLVEFGLDGSTRVLGVAGDRTLSSPIVDPSGAGVVIVVDQAEIRVIDRNDGSERRMDEGRHAFVIDPIVWNGRVVWHGWNPPNMPWDASELVSEHGVVSAVAGRRVQQPDTNLDGRRIGWLDDASGWLNVTTGDGRRIGESFEHGGPPWGERLRSWCWSPDGSLIAFARNENGFGRLCTFDPTTGRIDERAKAIHGQLSWRGRRLVAIRTGGKTPTQIVVYDTDDWSRRTVAVGPTYEWGGHRALVEPDLLTVDDGDGSLLHARLYRAPRSNGTLLCWIHGGPTDQWTVSFNARFSFWIDRGYSILVPDHRGSTGHGRAYTDALHGEWGRLDARDVMTVLEDVQRRHGFNARGTAVLGSSAGGLTALVVALERADLVSAVVVAYPVSDIAALDGTTHRFEAHYNRTLMGDPLVTIDRSKERSPIHRATELSVPVLLLHGDADPVVAVDQSRRLADRARNRVEYVEYPGEGHGFRTWATRVDEYRRTEDFLIRHLS
ncbi:MAG: prolyl oligopeptidase family serine peptidase [Actinomycetota bacterium]|nr:prolyl oligopeptidase family serine peptidase [Actinomycetota bacterium]MDA2971922.1 prolyl oligopeptidase family serine peptidase [Actinomycetota bacterium]MDA3001672.1 prolyl oligopeptidase family serine peptidase [Actinomycetota bacterium]